MEKINMIYKDNNEEPIIIEENKIPYLEFTRLKEVEFITHGFSTRMGGVSDGIFESMNLGFGRGDLDCNVLENFKRMGEALGVTTDSMVHSKQTHTKNVLTVRKEHKGNGVTKPNELEDIDGLITNIPGICLVTSYADCVPLYFVDTENRGIGLSHSGWRGTVQKIGLETIRMMQKEFGTKPENLIVAIGPSICQECYEVSEDVIEQFKEAFFEKDWESLFYIKENGKYQLNLWKANELVFLEAGVSKENIVQNGICTCCNSDILFSHRASHGKRGNLAAFLSIREE